MGSEMEERLKAATKLRQDARRELKIASSLEPAQAADFHIAAIFHNAAADNLMLNVPPSQIVSGEIVPTESERPDGKGGWAIRDTLAIPDAAAIAASLERTELLTNADALALGIDAAQSVGDHNSLESMLAHQMALAHRTAFELTGKAMLQRDTVEMARLINVSARMMSVYQSGLLTLNRLRTGGTQTVTVQHVAINGGQSVVAGTVHTGGHPSKLEGGKDETREQPHTTISRSKVRGKNTKRSAMPSARDQG